MKKYIVMALSAIVLAIVFLQAAAYFSVCYTNAQNEKYRSAYETGAKGISSPWYEEGLHVVDESFINELDKINNTVGTGNIIALGSSLSRISFNRNEAEAPEGYDYTFLVCGNGCYKSDRQLYELYRLNRNSENDYIKLEISYSTFRDMKTSITETILDKWGKYSVTKEGGIKENAVFLQPVYSVNKEMIKLQNTWELLTDAAEQYTSKNRIYDEIIPGNFRNNYFNYETVGEGIHITSDMKEELLSLMQDINANNHLIIELSPLPEGLAATENGKLFTKYVESELLPYLKENNIPYFDYRADYSEDEFCDGVHLGYKAAIKYTRQLNEDLNGVING